MLISYEMSIFTLLIRDAVFYILSPAGVVQGMITGIRGLCNGLGPALYGFVFYLFHVELSDTDPSEKGGKSNMANPTDEVNMTRYLDLQSHWIMCKCNSNTSFSFLSSPQSAIIPGPPFLFGACSVLLSLLVALFIPEHTGPGMRPGAYKKHSNGAQSHSHSPQGSGAEGKEPLLEDSSV